MQGEFETRRNGVLIAYEKGTATFLCPQGRRRTGEQFFIHPGTKGVQGE